MKHILRKMTSICIAIAVVATMGLTSLATENIDGNGNVIGDKEPAAELTSTLIIEKELTGYNPTTTQVYAPNVSYSYTIAGIDAQKVVTDEDGVSATTQEGPDGAAITETISWSSTEKINASAAGEANRKDITIDLSSVAFPGAGVYRYEITETCAAKEANGVTDGTIAEVRYLDVYVRDAKADEDPGYKIYGYVLFENNNNIDGRDEATTDTVEDAVKTEGFVKTDSLTTDSYYTYNVTVTKELRNDSSHEDNAFPFEFVFTKDAGVTGSFNLVSSLTSDPVGMADSVTANLANGESIKYTGIPCGTVVDIIETNNVSTAAYQVTTTGADTNITNKLVNYQETTGDTAVEVNGTTVGAAGTNYDITFTNTLALISPTGVVLAVVPFIILLGFGVGLMVVCTTKRKKEDS